MSSQTSATLAFTYDNLRFEGRDLTIEWDVTLDIMVNFRVVMNGIIVYEQDGLPIVEFAIFLNDWLLEDFPARRDFIPELTEFEERGWIQFRAVGSDQWRLLVASYPAEPPLIESEDLKAAVLAYLATVIYDLKSTFGIKNFAMIDGYSGQAIYSHNPCTRCGRGVGFWWCGDGATFVLKCERCDIVWREPHLIPLPAVRPIPVEDSKPLSVPLFQRGISRWATIEEIEARGWATWVAASRPTERAVTKVRINTAEEQ